MTPFSITKSVERANASPTVSLERGNYRLRAPLRGRVLYQESDPDQPAPPLRRPVNPTMNKSVSMLLFLLAVAAFSSFGIAYYLFTKRWALVPLHLSEPKPDAIPEANAFMRHEQPFFNNTSTHASRRKSGEKYLAYLPHSGFHNQRIAFENALVLAYALGRTLLVPPIRLGNKPIRYVEYDTLVSHHEMDSKEGLRHCLLTPPVISSPIECLDYFDSTTLPWTFLVGLSAISGMQRLIHLPNASQRWLYQDLDLQDSDIKALRDETPYQYRFLDTDDDTSPSTDRYSRDVYFSNLATSQEPLLQFGTLFGTSRLRLKNDTYMAYRRFVRENMELTNQQLAEATGFIAHELQNSFISVHLRTGDGRFKKQSVKTIHDVWSTLLQDVFGFSDPAMCNLEKRLTGKVTPNCGPDLPCENCSQSDELLATLASMGSGLNCRSPRHWDSSYNVLNAPVYVATDLRHPDTHPDLELFRRTFPCIFFLDDFTPRLRMLDALRSSYDGVGLRPFLLPLVDGMVAARGFWFVGTEGSTFSKFVTNMWQNAQKSKVPGSISETGVD